MAALHDLAARAGRRLQCLAGAESQVLHEMVEISGIGSLRIGGEAVITADNDSDSTLSHLVVRAAGRLIEWFQAFEKDAALRAIVAAHAVQPRQNDADRWAREDAVPCSLQEVKRFFVGVVAMVDHVDTMLDGPFYRGRGARVGRNSPADRMRSLDTRRHLG